MGRKDKALPVGGEAGLSTGMLLRQARQSKKISLTMMAELLGYTKGYLSGAENGSIRVSDELVLRYEKALGLDTGELEELEQVLQRTEVAQKKQIWVLPYQRNRFFTGRTAFLETIHHRLMNSNVVPHSLAITGLGGLGKTQLVVEYAYRYRHEYSAVLWFSADTQESLIDSCVHIANELDLPERGAQDRNVTIRVIQRWLKENPHCLIVLDNVEDLVAIYDFLSQLGESHIILTTRAQAIGAIAQTLELEKMDTEESLLLLLRRAQMIAANAPLESVAETSLNLARKIAKVMEGLPLALNQAASYIEGTGCGLNGYLRLIEEQLAKMLKVDDRTCVCDYHSSVAATWTVSFAKIKQVNPAAAELLYLCAFLWPEKIYEEFIMDGAAASGPELQAIAGDPIELHWAIAELRKYSLLRTDSTSGALSIHRLVQTVIQDTMDEETKHMWAERAVNVTNQAFPRVEVARWHETWSKCQRYFSQAEACIALVKRWSLMSSEVNDLLSKTGKYLEERTQFDDAEQLYQLAFQLNMQKYGEDHILTAQALGNLAGLYERQNNFAMAEQSYQRALFLLDKIGLEHDLSIVKNYIALLKKMEREQEAGAWKQRLCSLQPKQLAPVIKRVSVNDDDEDIIYYGEWRTIKSIGDFNNDAHVTDCAGDAFTYTFEGWGIDIIADTSSLQGEIAVFIDDIIITTIKTVHIDNKHSQTIVFSKTDLQLMAHTLRVILVHGTFILDALAVFSYEKEDFGYIS